jgi:hypothetical protein
VAIEFDTSIESFFATVQPFYTWTKRLTTKSERVCVGSVTAAFGCCCMLLWSSFFLSCGSMAAQNQSKGKHATLKVMTKQSLSLFLSNPIFLTLSC